MTEQDVPQDNAIAAMVAAEIKAFTDGARGPAGDAVAFQGMVNRHEQFWKFCVDEDCMKPGHIARRGWVVVGPSMKSKKGAENFRQFRDMKHAEPLTKYGQYEVGYELHKNASARLPFGKFTPIVTAPGGINEFPKDQITAMGWHRNPVIKRARPDVADVVDVMCPFGCRTGVFASEDAKRQHVEAAHEKQMVSTALGEQISKPMEQIAALVAKQQGGGDATQIAAIVAAVMSAMNSSKGSNGSPAPVVDEVVDETAPDEDEPALPAGMMRGRDVLAAVESRVRTRGPRVPALA